MPKPNPVAAFLAALPAPQCAALAPVRAVINKHLPRGFEEVLQGKLILWQVPLATKPDTYNKRPLMLAGLAAGAKKCSLYLLPIYSDERARADFERAFEKANKRLDAGKSCVRFGTADDLVLDAVGKAISKHSVKSWIALHDAVHATRKR